MTAILCEQTAEGYKVQFNAMASPCEVLIESEDESLAKEIGHLAASEAWRIENKYSRYQSDSILSLINHMSGQKTGIDDETFRLLIFADQCYQLSDGLFDITSGILRRAWYFDGSDRLPQREQIQRLLPKIGWSKVMFDRYHITMQPGMELDLGGIGKEYAVDSAIKLIQQQFSIPILVNFGGDLATTKPRENGKAWIVGIDNAGNSTLNDSLLELKSGAIATSGDANRYLLRQGKRYSHILNPKTGWPIEDAPHTITVTAPNCTQAGFLATLGSLKGALAERFLDEQQIRYWCVR